MLDKFKISYCRKKIGEKQYTLDRANLMSIQIFRWKSLEKSAKTTRERTLCRLMLNMYLKRYIYYLNK